MWGTLRADFSEFVSTVTSDAAETLTALDVTLDGDGDGTEADIIDIDTGMILTGEPPTSPTPTPPPPLTDKDEIKAYLYEMDEVFLDELAQEEDESSEFDLDARTEEIATLLQTDAGLEAAFSRLADQVEYKKFWKRYFFRFSEEKLEETYHHYYYYDMDVKLSKQQQEEEEQEQARKTGLGLGALKGVTSFLGGAVKRMIEEGQDDDEDDEDGQEEQGEEEKPSHFFNTAQQTGVNAMSFFKGGAVRPPFVLNTAVSENDDDDDEEEEEELGWDDDEEEDGEDGEDENAKGDDDDDDDRVGQIEFKDVEKEQLQEQLEQAMTERDMLHKTVELQTEEIKKLKEGVASVDENKQVTALKMQLFEKDSELAALRARLEDDRDREDEYKNPSSSSSDDLMVLRAELAQRDEQILHLQQELQLAAQKLQLAQDNIGTEASEAQKHLSNAIADLELQKSSLLQANTENADLQVQLQDVKALMQRLENENDALRNSQQDSGNEANIELEVARQELMQMRVQLETLSLQNDTLKQEVESEKVKWTTLETTLTKTKSLLEAKDRELSEKTQILQTVEAELETTKAELAKKTVTTHVAHPSSPGSTSTAVKVPSPPPPVVEDKSAQPVVAAPTAANQQEERQGGEDDDSDWGDW